ncbi:MAG TPA: hypothetical protein PLH19_13645 [Anaerolineae bacterium]|nr:hypothetical protein [Anaerolineae bacterium]HQH39562.1 hypothetical protein [Anaerolineae bacterium]
MSQAENPWNPCHPWQELKGAEIDRKFDGIVAFAGGVSLKPEVLR